MFDKYLYGGARGTERKERRKEVRRRKERAKKEDGRE